MKLWSQDRYHSAWNFACQAHKHQTMPGSDLPYVNHIAAVVMEVMSAIARGPAVEDPDLAVQCALLHDVIEDTAVSYEQVVTGFGQQVASGVLALTKNPHLSTKVDQMQDSLTRIRAQPKEVWMVKLADRISNLQAPPHYWTQEKIRRYQNEAKTIYTALSSAHEVLASRLLQKIGAYSVFLK